MEHLAGFIAAAAALTGSPGPANLALAAASAAFGPRRAVPIAAGIISGVYCVLLVTGTGIFGLVLALPGVGPALTVAGVLYMVYLAYRIATAPPLSATSTVRAPGYRSGLFLSLGNPKVYATITALASGFTLVPEHPGLDLGAKALGLLPILSLVGATWVLAGGVLSRALRDPRQSRAINVGLAVLLLVSVAAALLL